MRDNPLANTSIKNAPTKKRPRRPRRWSRRHDLHRQRWPGGLGLGGGGAQGATARCVGGHVAHQPLVGEDVQVGREQARIPVEVEHLLDEERELAREADAVAVGDLGKEGSASVSTPHTCVWRGGGQHRGIV